MGYKKKTQQSSDTKPNLDVFKILGNILVDKDMSIYENHIRNELFESAFSSFIILRYLSMNSNPNVRKTVLENQLTLEKLADRPRLMYKMLMKIVPSTSNRFTPYIKSGFPRAN